MKTLHTLNSSPSQAPVEDPSSGQPNESSDSPETLDLPIAGMSCASCATRIERRLLTLPGVREATVNYGDESAKITLEPGAVDSATIVEEIRSTGYDVVAREESLTIAGMTCAGCASRVERALKDVAGVMEASVNLAAETAQVTAIPLPGLSDALRKAVEDAGYEVIQTDEHVDAHEEQQERHAVEYHAVRRRFLIAAAFTLPVFLVSMGWIPGASEWPFQAKAWFLLALTTPVQFWAGRRFYVGAWNVLRHGGADMNTLIATGTSAAFAYSVVVTIWPGALAATGLAPAVYYETAAVIITLVLFGRMLESRAKNKTTGAIRALMDLRPAQALVERDGVEQSVPAADVQVGDVVVVHPGERLPVDGVVLEGRSAVDESMMTGESLPVDKAEGDEATGGTVNRSGYLKCRATRVGQETVLSHIIRLVEQAQGTKAPVQRLVDRISGVFVPIVLGIAAATFVVWWLIGPEPRLTFAMLSGVAVLIVTCPCALGLATPTAIMVGTGRGAELGILIKGGDVLERTRQLDTVVFDKTGTLTTGSPEVVAVVPADGWTDALVSERAASAELRSEHPLGEAIVRHAGGRGMEPAPPESFEAVAGGGVIASVDGATVVIGNPRQMAEGSVDIAALRPHALEFQSDGATVVYVAVDGQAAGLIAVADRLKSGARDEIAHLREQGLRVLMLTGDAEATARAIAEQAGVDDVIAEVRPEEKAAAVNRLRESGAVVAMVGDGINDAPALATADLGIAMGTGTDAAMETSDITLIRGDVGGVRRAIGLSRATLRTIKQNLFWAFIYNVIGIPIAAGVLYPINGMLLDPMLAAAAMAFSSVSVVANSLRLKRWRA